MRIGLVIFRAQPGLGGAERYAIDLGKELRSRGHDVCVIASKFDDIADLLAVNVPAHGLTRRSRYLRFVDGVERHVLNSRYDIVHAFLPVRGCNVYHAQAGLETLSLQGDPRSPAGPVTLMRRGFAFHFDLKRLAFASVEQSIILGPKPPVVICLSKFERDRAVKHFSNAKPEGFIKAIYNGIDTTRFLPIELIKRRAKLRKSLGISADSPLLLFVGNDFERKGLTTAIHALGKLNHQKALLLVVGAGDATHFTGVANKAGVVGRVLFVGRSPRVDDFLAAADAMVLPTRFEPFGMVAVEAMLMGVPPVVSRVAGVAEVINDQVDGLIVDDATDVGAWTRAMQEVLHPPTRDAMSVACLARREEFGFERHIEQIDLVYKQAMTR